MRAFFEKYGLPAWLRYCLYLGIILAYLSWLMYWCINLITPTEHAVPTGAGVMYYTTSVPLHDVVALCAILTFGVVMILRSVDRLITLVVLRSETVLAEPMSTKALYQLEPTWRVPERTGLSPQTAIQNYHQ